MAEPRFGAVRLLGRADAAAYRDIRLAALAAEPRAFSAAFEEESASDLQAFAVRLETNRVFAVDDGNSHLVGIAGLAIPTSPKLCHRGYIWGVYVRPEARGHAIAAHLLAGIVADSRTRLEALTLGVGTYNVGAIKAYRAAGFVETGLEKRVMRVGDEYIDEITMLLDLR